MIFSGPKGSRAFKRSDWGWRDIRRFDLTPNNNFPEGDLLRIRDQKAPQLDNKAPHLDSQGVYYGLNCRLKCVIQ